MISQPGSPRVSTRPQGPGLPMPAPMDLLRQRLLAGRSLQAGRRVGRQGRWWVGEGVGQSVVCIGGFISTASNIASSGSCKMLGGQRLAASSSNACLRSGRWPSRVWITRKPLSRNASSTLLQATSGGGGREGAS